MTHQWINIIQALFSVTCMVHRRVNIVQTLFIDVRKRGSSTYQHNPIYYTVPKGSMTHQRINMIQALFTVTSMVHRRINIIQVTIKLSFFSDERQHDASTYQYDPRSF